MSDLPGQNFFQYPYLIILIISADTDDSNDDTDDSNDDTDDSNDDTDDSKDDEDCEKTKSCLSHATSVAVAGVFQIVAVLRFI